MFVVKRSGRKEEINFDKITRRIASLANMGGSVLGVDVIDIAKKVVSGVYDGVHTSELDTLACETAAQRITVHPDYGVLASRIFVSSMHKETPDTFSEYVRSVDHLLRKEFVQTVESHAEDLDAMVDSSRDYLLSYFGLKTLEKSYLLRDASGTLVERPQYMFLRVALAIHGDNMHRVRETYDLMSTKHFIHATPTLYNAGKHRQQLSSCFLTQIEKDSIDGIFNTVKNCALISKSAGGIGLSVSNVRATGSPISGGGTSNGLLPMLRVLNNVARYVDQGGNKRPGAIAVYIEPWHADIFDVLELRKNHGKDELRARDLFTALWVPDIFMRRVKGNEDWSLFCPSLAPGLDGCWGAEFDALYTEYERTRPHTTIKAQKLWAAIVASQIETGTPYMLYKDACNRTSNHNHLGTIKGSNLCTEILEHFSADETAVCNLASIGLPAFVKAGRYDLGELHRVVQVVTRNLDTVIDINDYPIPQAEKSNRRHRPIGIGVQGLADAFIALGLPFDSEAARELNRHIFETIYHAALTASCAIAKEKGMYGSYTGSRIDHGLLHCDGYRFTPCGLWDWDTLRDQIREHGVRNSLLVAPMPTASTSQILGYNECFEPYTSNIYNRRVKSGEFQVVNTHLVKVLESLGLWNTQTKNEIIRNNGSIAAIANIPQDVKQLFRTVWEIPQKAIIDMAADRSPFIDQSQSLNIHLEDATLAKITSMHFYGWERGLKTGMYYLRTRPASKSIQFTIEPVRQCSINNPSCESCSG